MKRLTPLTACLWAIAVAATGTQSATRSVWDGVYTEAQATRGAALYTQHCALCHGPTLAGADGPPLTGVEFAGNWNGLSLGDLYDRVRTSMPPDDPGKLNAQERVDILAHLLRTGTVPPGEVELPRDVAGLAAIRFQAVRP